MQEVKVLLQREGDAALIAWQHESGNVEFVTTSAYHEDGTWNWGNYFGNDLEKALEDYKKRAGIGDD